MLTSIQYSKSDFRPSLNSNIYKSISTKDRVSDLKRRILNLEARNRSICQNYKNNLKEAFDTKIDTFRMEALLIRRSQNERKEAERNSRQKQLQQQKRNKVKQQKMERMSSKLYVADTLEERAEKARNKFLQERSVIQKQIFDNQHQDMLRKQNIRGSFFGRRLQIKKDKQRRKYMSQMKQRELYASQMKKQLEEIIAREEFLQKLQYELQALEQRGESVS